MHTHFCSSVMSFWALSIPLFSFIITVMQDIYYICQRSCCSINLCPHIFFQCVCKREKRRGRRGQSLLRDEIGEEEEEVVGWEEIERVVLLLTVTESGPLSCCQEKYTEAGINCTLTLFLFVHSSPLAALLLPPLFALSLLLFSLKFRQLYVSLRSDGQR